jgi:hypothetical protein
MKINSTPTAVKLAPPGAGLPKPELFVARLIFGWFRKTHSRSAITALFEEEQARVVELTESCSVNNGGMRILIKRLPGLEDSSRNWSVFMTLDHLRIVNEAVRQTMLELAAGRVPDRVASTAHVKPSPTADASTLARFSNECSAFLDSAASISDMRSEALYPHPWFGPLDAAGWHAMAAFHMRLHRKQIAAILNGMPAVTASRQSAS